MARVRPITLALLFPALIACSDGSSGGGGAADGEAALAALGFTPNDLADVAAGAMAAGLAWIADDGVIPTRLGDPCPSAVAGEDADESGHPDTLDITFDCVDDEGLVIAGTVSMSEYGDPAAFLEGAACEGVTEVGLPDWGMQGSFFLTVQEPGSTAYTLQGTVKLAEFPALQQLLVETSLTAADYTDDGGRLLHVGTTICAALPTDDSTDFPAGYVDTFVFEGAPPALLALECDLLADGTVAFDAYAGPERIASGVIDLAAEDGSEVVFD